MRPGFWEILLIVVLVLILFGHSKIPDLMKNLASGIKVFKTELGAKDDNASAPAVPAKAKAIKKKPAKKSIKKK